MIMGNHMNAISPVAMLSTFVNGLKTTFDPKRVIRELTDWKSREWVLLGLMVLAQVVAFAFGADWSLMGWIGLATGVFTILSLILVDRGRITNYLWGFLGSVVWLVVAIQNHLVGDMFSQSFYVIMQFVGIYAWQKQLVKQGQGGDAEVEPKKMTALMTILSVIGTLSIYAIVVTVSLHAHGTQVWLDGTLLPLGIVGQVLMTYGYRSQWVAWIALDIVNVVIWANQLQAGGPAAMSMFVLQVVMTINALYGCWLWFRPVDHASGEPALADGAVVGAGA
jgi:nicotinamide mononucleotide transporter